MSALLERLQNPVPKSRELELAHAHELDLALGLQVAGIEADLLVRAQHLQPQGHHRNWGHRLHQGNQTWVGLDPQTLLTPYLELSWACREAGLSPGDHLVDLGAGYGRMGIVLHFLHPEVRFTGYEIVPERVAEGSRVLSLLGCAGALLLQDLTDPGFRLPVADVYFIYDYGEVRHIRATLEQIAVVADTRPLKLVARGQGTRSLIDHHHPWLTALAREGEITIYGM